MTEGESRCSDNYMLLFGAFTSKWNNVARVERSIGSTNPPFQGFSKPDCGWRTRSLQEPHAKGENRPLSHNSPHTKGPFLTRMLLSLSLFRKSCVFRERKLKLVIFPILSRIFYRLLSNFSLSCSNSSLFLIVSFTIYSVTFTIC